MKINSLSTQTNYLWIGVFLILAFFNTELKAQCSGTYPSYSGDISLSTSSTTQGSSITIQNIHPGTGVSGSTLLYYYSIVNNSTFAYQIYGASNCSTGLSSPSYTFTASSPGTYTVRRFVFSCCSNGTASGNISCDPEILTVTLNTPLCITPTSAGSISASPSSVTAGSSVNIVNSGNPSGGTAPYQYLYQYSTSPSGTKTAITGWTTATSSSFTPSSSGTYYIWRNVRSSCGSGTVVASTTVSVSSACTTPTSAGIISASPSSVTAGSSVSIINSGNPSGGSGSYQYLYQYSTSAGGARTSITSWTTATSSSFTPPSVGVYYIWRNVRSSCGSGIVVAYNTVNVSAACTTPSSAGSISASPSSVTVGNSVNIVNSGNPSGGSGSYQYLYQYSTSPSGTRTSITGWTTATSSSFTPSSTGTYYIWRNVRSSCGSGIVVAYSTVSVSAACTAPSSAGSISASPSSVTAGSSVSIVNSGNPSGGSGSYQYLYQYSTSLSGTKTSITSWTTATSSSFTPSSAGTYYIWRNVRSSCGSGSIVAYNTVSVSPACTAPLGSGSISTSPTTVTAGSTITITNLSYPNGGSGSYQYKFQYAYTTSGARTTITNWTSSATSPFTVPNSASGTIYIWRQARSSCGSSSVEIVKGVNISPPPCNFTVNAGADVNICNGSSTNITAVPSVAGSYTYTWDNGLGNGATQTVSPTSTTTYTVTVTQGTCSKTDQVNVIIGGSSCGEICGNGIDDDSDGLIDCADPDCYLVANSGGTDTDGDGYDDNCDQDDDNDGILDVVECPATNSGLTGPLTTFTTSITTTDATSSSVPHILNSITYNGITYSDFITPDAYTPGYTVIDLNEINFVENGVDYVYSLGSNANYNQDIITDAFGNKNLNAHQSLDSEDFSDGDYYILTYNNPIISTTGGFIAITERKGNNEYYIDALDNFNNVLGSIIVNTTDYVDLGVNVFATGTQNAHMALYPVDDLAPIGTEISSLKISFGTSVTATNDGPDGKVFIIGDETTIICDYDGDGIPNDLDLDSDNDGCPDALEGGANFTHTNLSSDRLTGSVDANGIPTVTGSGQTMGSSQNESVNVCCDANISGYTDTDNDGVIDDCDEDDDNDGILDIVECSATNSGLTGSLTTFTTSITTTDATSSSVPHTLNSITYNGITYSDFITPDAYTPGYTVNDLNEVNFVENGVDYVYSLGSNANYNTDIITDAFGNKNLNAHQSLDSEDFTNGDYYILTYNEPIISTSGGFIAVTERNGNNEYYIDALDNLNNVLGSIIINTTDYVDLGVNVYAYGTQNAHMALYPVDDLAPIGAEISSLKISFGTSITATNDGPDGKVFIIGDVTTITCDYDGDGIPNDLDLDSDNDGCPDALEGGASFTYTNIDNSTALTGAVNANGVPTQASTGQALGTSQDENTQNTICDLCNPANPDYKDSDGDSYADYCDLDDDNDGILDTIECSSFFARINNYYNVTPAITDPPSSTYSTVHFNYYPLGSTRTYDYTDVNGNIYNYTENISCPSCAYVGIYTNPTYTDYGIISFLGSIVEGTPSSPRPIGSFESVEFVFNSGLAENVSFYLSDVDYTEEARVIGYNGATLVTPSIEGVVSSYQTLSYLPSGEAKLLSDGVTGGAALNQVKFSQPVDRIVISYHNPYGVGRNSGGFNFFGLFANGCQDDYDNDGIPNSLDLDSDGDGCLDAVEGAANITSANTVANRIGGSIDANGVPVLVNNGQGLGDSQDENITSGCAEICNNSTDDDGDGFIDCADSDCQPIISNITIAQPTCANKTSGQIVITATGTSALSYSIKNEPVWQTSNTFSTLGVGQYMIRVKNDKGCETEYISNPVILDFNTCVEICNNGIDDDGDGKIDCDDTDCENISTTGIIDEGN